MPPPLVNPLPRGPPANKVTLGGATAVMHLEVPLSPHSCPAPPSPATVNLFGTRALREGSVRTRKCGGGTCLRGRVFCFTRSSRVYARQCLREGFLEQNRKWVVNGECGMETVRGKTRFEKRCPVNFSIQERCGRALRDLGLCTLQRGANRLMRGSMHQEGSPTVG